MARQRHRNHHALALPAGKLVRETARARFRLRDAHALQRLHRGLSGARRVHAHMQLQRLCNLPPNGVDGVQRGHRLLKNHGDIAPTHGLQFCWWQLQHGLAVENDFAGELGGFNQTQQRQRGNRLAGTGFPHQRQLFACIQRERHAIHHAPFAEIDAEIAHFQQAHAASPPSPSSTLRGSSASRSASPIKISSRSINTSTPNVLSDIHQASRFSLP